MMEKDKTAFMPRDKKYTVTNRAQLPDIPFNVFRIWFARQRPVIPQNFYVVLNLFQFDAAVLIFLVGKFIKIICNGTPPLFVTVK